MADPHHIEVLDGFDRFTVLAYRTGLVFVVVGLGWSAMASLAGRSAGFSLWVLWFGAAVCAGNIHLYDKRVRWFIAWLVWSALLLRALSPHLPPVLHPWAAGFANGFVLMSVSGIVLKEWFCFRIPLVRVTPLFLGAAVFGRFFGLEGIAGVGFGVGAIGVAAVTLAKWRMPLTHDVGDRSRYQV